LKKKSGGADECVEGLGEGMGKMHEDSAPCPGRSVEAFQRRRSIPVKRYPSKYLTEKKIQG
jgi:hypothetical protein